MRPAGLTVLALLVAGACGTPAPAKPAETAAAPTKAPEAPVAADTTHPAPAASAQPSPQQTNDAADRSVGARTMGGPRSPITIYEVSDFQCPFCRDFFENTLPAVKREFVGSGKVRLIFVNFPITQLHPNALAAHEFAMCAADQGKFWPVHDLLYHHQEGWAKLQDPRPFFYELADSAQLARDALRNCLMTGAVRGLLQADMQSALRAGIHSTPSFIINGALLAGAVPMKDLRPILDSVYRAATAPH